MGKNQHFVPQFYLRKFSEYPDKKEINLYNLKNEQFYRTVPIKNQACKSFFYDTDNSIEMGLGNIEVFASSVFSKIENNNCCISDNDKGIIFLFIVSEYIRTKKFIDDTSSTIDVLSRLMSDEKISSQFYNSQNDHSCLQRISTAASISMLKPILNSISDLNMCISINKTTREFITSDNPVILCNSFLENKIEYSHSTRVIAASGLSMVFPVSTNVLICLYDCNVYELKRNAQFLTDRNHIDLINKLQIANSDKNIFYKSKYTEKWIKHYLVSINNILNKENKKIVHFGKEGNTTQITLETCKSIASTLGITIPFLNIKKNPTYFNNNGRFVRPSTF